MATGNSLVSDALSRIGALASGTTPTATELSDGVSELNRMLGTWNAEMGAIFAETVDTLAWTAGLATMTIGAGGDHNVARPVEVIGAWYRDSASVDYGIDVITHREYQEISTKTTQTTNPAYLAFNPTFSGGLGTLFIWPIPSTLATIRLLSLKPIADLTGAGTVTLPPGYEDAIICSLAVRLGVIYGADLSQIMHDMAIETKKAIVEGNVHFRQGGIDPMVPGVGSGYNSRAYWNI